MNLEKLEQYAVTLEKYAALAAKFELHAIFMLLVGAGLALLGHKEEGQLVIGAALAVFRGQKS